eukprot:6599664-Pyramimonas_sp.AAC.1
MRHHEELQLGPQSQEFCGTCRAGSICDGPGARRWAETQGVKNCNAQNPGELVKPLPGLQRPAKKLQGKTGPPKTAPT